MPKFVPRKPEKEVISMRISVDTLREIDRRAGEFGISRNELINQMIDYALANMGEPAALSISLCRRFSVAAPTSLVTCSSTGRQHRANAAAVSTASEVTPNRHRKCLFRLRADRLTAISPPHRRLLKMEWMVTVISSWNPRSSALAFLSVLG